MVYYPCELDDDAFGQPLDYRLLIDVLYLLSRVDWNAYEALYAELGGASVWNSVGAAVDF